MFAPAVYVSITIEAGRDGDAIHLHAGGQGVWVARMLRQLDHEPVVCAPLGGESGRALLGLIAEWGIQVRPVETLADTPAYVHDRRDGERVELARAGPPELNRHEVDELYGCLLQLALDAGCCVVTGPEDERTVSAELYRRLAADLDAAQVDVVGDLHGPALGAYLDGGRLPVLKVSASDLVDDGLLGDDERDDETAVDRIADRLVEQGADTVLVSRGAAPILATTPEGRFRITGPHLEPVDTKGSGDSMTAALASSLLLGLDTSSMLARAWAAGAANTTRGGLGSGTAGLIDRLQERADVDPRRDS